MRSWERVLLVTEFQKLDASAPCLPLNSSKFSVICKGSEQPWSACLQVTLPLPRTKADKRSFQEL